MSYGLHHQQRPGASFQPNNKTMAECTSNLLVGFEFKGGEGGGAESRQVQNKILEPGNNSGRMLTMWRCFKARTIVPGIILRGMMKGKRKTKNMMDS